MFTGTAFGRVDATAVAVMGPASKAFWPFWLNRLMVTATLRAVKLAGSGADGCGGANPGGDLGVAAGFAVGNGLQLAPHTLLEIRALEVQREVESPQVSRKVVLQLSCKCPQHRVGVVGAARGWPGGVKFNGAYP